MNGPKLSEPERPKRTSPRDKTAIIINSASYEKVAYALTIAATCAALGNEVHVLFTYGALTRLTKDGTDRVGEETEAWIREDVRVGLVTGSMNKVSDMLKDLKSFGGKIYACVSAMAFHNIMKDELVEEVSQVTGITAFLETTRGASIVIYV